MLPTINGKSFLECKEEDLSKLIEEPDYRENEYIDYKKNFAFLEIPKEKKNEITKEKSEFKSDVCAFANAEGGYLIFGISDDKSCASELCGIDIPNNNTDQFERDRRNDLVGIQPRLPYLKFNFVTLENGKYVVIIYVKHDSFAPYLHVTDNKNYQAFRRTGNGKNTMTYMELRNMFNQSLSLDKEIYNYRKERIQYYSEQSNYSRYLLLHIIPETFTDPSYNQNILFLERNNKISFSTIFKAFNANLRSTPCVDGLRFTYYGIGYSKVEGYVNNNGIVECFCPLSLYIDETRLKYFDIWGILCKTLTQYKEIFSGLNDSEKIYICLSIVGGKKIITERYLDKGYVGYIDRNNLLFNPIIIENLVDNDSFNLSLKRFHIEYLQSIGVKYNKELDDLLKEVYGSEPQGE